VVKLDNILQNNETIQSVLKSEKNKETKKDKDTTSKSDNEAIKELLIELRDNKIADSFTIDDNCILSPVMIEELIKYKPYDKDELVLKIPSTIIDNINSNQMTKYRDEIFEILGKPDE